MTFRGGSEKGTPFQGGKVSSEFTFCFLITWRHIADTHTGTSIVDENQISGWLTISGE
jgi:hypothetical protein